MKKFLPFLLFLTGFSIYSQEDPTRKVVKASFSPEKLTMINGGSAKVKVNLTIDKGYHIYIGKKTTKSKNIITNFSSASKDFSIIENQVPKGDSTYDPENIILKNSGAYEIEVFDISSKEREFTGKLEINLETQVCDSANICFKPQKIPFSIDTNVSGKRKSVASSTRKVKANSNIKWSSNYDEALKLAKKKKLNVYAVASAPEWCYACRILEDKTFADKRVYDMLNQSFVPLFLHVDTSPDVGKVFKGGGIPSNFILDENGKEVFSKAGAYNADGFLSVFSKYAKTPSNDSPTPAPLPPDIDNQEDGKPTPAPLPPDFSDNNSTPSDGNSQKIPKEFEEKGRFKIRKVNIEHTGNVHTREKGGFVRVSMEILHDCSSCGNSVNQIIVGLGGEAKAQESVWNGKQRSGGALLVVNSGTEVEALAEDNSGPAEWVQVFFKIKIPDQKGTYFLRARYAQGYQGRLMTKAGLKRKQPVFEKVLGWWKVDRPEGPDSSSNIGAIIVK
ncbi:MAG: DUF255 domain-containing protein [Leptospiraceae bacterium]|nr:DUF255 domain-containing protein [Leptospiraceae bacterium]